VTPLMQKVTFKPLKSFTPIVAHSAAEHTALIVSTTHCGSPQRVHRVCQENPGKVKYSTSGVGTGMHVAMEVIAKGGHQVGACLTRGCSCNDSAPGWPRGRLLCRHRIPATGESRDGKDARGSWPKTAACLPDAHPHGTWL
jgi:hypothetical protein